MKKKNKKYIVILIIIIGIVLAFSFYNGKNPKGNKDTFLVQKQDLIQKVNVVSQVQPKESIELAFQTAGRVEKINFKVGQKIKEGDIIMELNNDQLNSSLTQKQASLQSAKATLGKYKSNLKSAKLKLDQLKKGAKPEQVKVSESEVKKAQSSLETAESSLEQTKEKANVELNNLYDDIETILNNAYLKADDAINYQVDALFKNDNSEKAEITFITGNSQAKIDVESKRPQISQTITTLKANVENIYYIDKEQALQSSKEKLIEIRSFLNRLRDALNSSIGLSSTDLTSYKSNINTARSNINTVISDIETQQQLIASQKVVNVNNIQAAEDKVEEAKDSLELAKNNLELTKSGATKEEIKIQESNIEQAELNIQSQKAKIQQVRAEIQSILTSIKETNLESPINGILVKKKVDIGEVVSQNQVVALINSQGQYEIKANVPEMDISKVKIGDKAEVSLDAYKDKKFIAKVVEIAPAETILDGLTTYETTLYFINENKEIKSGMTADVDIITAEKKNTLVVPGRAIIREDGKTFVQKLLSEKNKEKNIKKVEVKIGIKGSTGKVEILKGLNSGDTLVVSY